MGICRPLTKKEVPLITGVMDGKWSLRNRAIIWIGISTGYRVNEIVTLRIKDVMFNGEVKKEIIREPKHLKGNARSRNKRLFAPARAAVAKWVEVLRAHSDEVHDLSFLFRSRKGGHVTPSHVWNIINKAAEAAGIDTARIGTHSMRKTFADRMYRYYSEKNKQVDGENYDVMRMVQKELGHADILTTYRYMDFKIDENKPEDIFSEYMGDIDPFVNEEKANV